MEKAIIDNLNNERVATMEKEFNLKENIKELGMEEAKLEQNKILQRHNLLSLNEEQIDGICSLIREVNKIHKEFIRRLKEYFPKEIAVKNRLFHKIIDKLSGGL